MGSDAQRVSRRDFLRAAMMMTGGAVLAACGANGAPAASDTGASAAGTTAPNASAAGGEISFMSWGTDQERQLYADSFLVFEKDNPGTKVNYIYTPQDYDTKFKTMVAGNQVPDVFYVPENQLVTYAATGKLLDLDPYVQQDPSLTADFVPGLLDFGKTEEGKLYAIPKGWEPFVVYINKELFQKAGVEVPTGDWTMEEFREVAKQMTVTEGDRTTQYGTSLDTWWGPWSTFVGNEGGEWFKDGKSNFNDPAVIKGLTRMYDLFQTDKSAPSPSALTQSGLGTSQMFETGRVAMYPIGGWVVADYRKSVKFDWTAVEMPKGTTRINPIFSGMLAVGADSKNKDMAVKLVKFLMSKEGQKGVTALGLQMPPYQSQSNDPELVTEPPDRTAFKAAAAYHGSPVQLAVARTGRFAEFIDKYVTPELDLAFNGQQTVEDAVAKIDNNANANLFK